MGDTLVLEDSTSGVHSIKLHGWTWDSSECVMARYGVSKHGVGW